MLDNEQEAIDDTFEDDFAEDQEADTLEEDGEEIEDGVEPDTDEHPEDDDGEEPEDAEDLDDQARVTLDNGEEVTLAELKRGFFREADYTRKNTEVAVEREALKEERKTLETRNRAVETAYQNLQQFVANMIPPKPDLALAKSNPAAFQYQKELRESAIFEVEQLFEQGQGYRDQVSQFSQEDMAKERQKAEAELVKAMPHLKDPAKKAAFDSANVKTAQEFGFSEQEIGSTMDPRILQLVHYARLGKLAEHNRSNAKRRLTEPKKGKAAPAKPPAQNANNRKALARLRKSGSLEDALQIDFD